MKIIIVSYGDDGHMNHLTKIANEAGVETLLFDAGGYPNDSEEIGISYDGSCPELTLSIDGSTVKAEDIRGVWWRRPRGAKSGERNPIDQYMHLEGEVVIRSLSDFLPNANWVSDPEATRMACRKPVQLKIAKQLGMKIPYTCISNSQEAVKKFIKNLGERKLIMKPVGTSFVNLPKENKEDLSRGKVIFTQVIDPDLVLQNITMVKNCPVIFQESVEKDSDMRITVVDDKVFCAEIILEGCKNPANVDWRNHDGVRVYRQHSLPKEISDQCVRFTRAMGLRFGCIDMAYSKEKGYTFFEINPQGQWLPSEVQLGYPISTTLLKALTQ